MTLDYGCGLGQITAALTNKHYFDFSDYAYKYLSSRNHTVYKAQTDIPEEKYDYILSYISFAF